MTDDRLVAAIGRLDRALTRAEAAADRYRGYPSGDPALVERHQRLRDAAGQALAMLDEMIEAR